jgi:hypothetical protein
MGALAVLGALAMLAMLAAAAPVATSATPETSANGTNEVVSEAPKSNPSCTVTGWGYGI